MLFFAHLAQVSPIRTQHGHVGRLALADHPLHVQVFLTDPVLFPQDTVVVISAFPAGVVVAIFLELLLGQTLL